MARILSGVGLDLLDLGKGASACIAGEFRSPDGIGGLRSAYAIRVTGSYISDFQKK
jgi:hypothetical protein